MSLLTANPGPQWHFYSCRQLRCGLFYEDGACTFPPEMEEVLCVDISRPVMIRLVGRGQEGYDAVCALYGDKHLFPVDLYHNPHRLCPIPSLNMPQWRLNEWCRVIRAFRRANRR